ncbi:MAG TPA: flavin reductase [Anaerolineaceae bacterium]
MTLQEIRFDTLSLQYFKIWQRGLLLTSGDFRLGHFNTMTVGWGSLGRMWGKPFVQVVVRPQRYTFQFMEKYPTFTLCAFADEHSDAIQLLGTRSGRDTDKISLAALHPVAASTVQAPAFDEATLVIECRKIYWQDMDPDNFLDPSIQRNYPAHDFHRIYFGEIVAIRGEPEFNS